ncbi:MAG: DUF29 domain-containing protein [Crocosphaera sp.]|nr:DUF29 domain-containing protein [Crocosphaera sp.]
MFKNLAKLYETDFVAWTEETTKLIKEKQFEEVDWNSVIEEIESLGKSDKRELKSRLAVLIQHLLKWQYQQNLRSGSWKNTIDEQRNSIADLLNDSPSLKPYITEIIEQSYRRGGKAAINETGLSPNTFPSECCYTIKEILDDNFLPEM